MHTPGGPPLTQVGRRAKRDDSLTIFIGSHNLQASLPGHQALLAPEDVGESSRPEF